MVDDVNGPGAPDRDEVCPAVAGGGAGVADDLLGPPSPVMRADSVPVVSFGVVADSVTTHGFALINDRTGRPAAIVVAGPVPEVADLPGPGPGRMTGGEFGAFLAARGLVRVPGDDMAETGGGPRW